MITDTNSGLTDELIHLSYTYGLQWALNNFLGIGTIPENSPWKKTSASDCAK